MDTNPTHQNHPAEPTQPDNLRLSLPQDFTASREWPKEIIVEPARLAWDLWGDTEGDITAAYSGDKRPNVKTFVHEGQLFTSMGGSEFSVHCYPLLMPETYDGPGKVKYSHEGETVAHDRRKFTLGPEVTFSCRLTLEEEISRLRRMYAYGGYFVSGKTYQEMLLDFQEDDRTREGRRAAVVQELTRRTFPKTQPEMLAELGKLSGVNGMADASQFDLPGM